MKSFFSVGLVGWTQIQRNTTNRMAPAMASPIRRRREGLSSLLGASLFFLSRLRRHRKGFCSTSDTKQTAVLSTLIHEASRRQIFGLFTEVRGIRILGSSYP